MDEIKEMGTSRGSGIQCLTIVGQIEGHQLQPDDVKTTKYEHVFSHIVDGAYEAEYEECGESHSV